MPGVSEEQVRQARQVDLLSYLQHNEPHELIKSGRSEYRMKTHGSLVISKGMFYWNRGGFGGRSAIDYLMKVRGMGFVDAVQTILGARLRAFVQCIQGERVICVYGKKSETKFTVQFSRFDSSHLQVADILNRQRRYGKAQYIVDAVMHYIDCGLAEPALRSVRADEKHIEDVVSRILSGRHDGVAARHGSNLSAIDTGDIPLSAVSEESELTSSAVTQPASNGEDATITLAPETIDDAGLNAIAGALDMFRRK